MNNLQLIDNIIRDIEIIDKDTGSNLKMAKAFYMKGMHSILDNGLLVSALADINIDVVALKICEQHRNLNLVTWTARDEGKEYARKWMDK